MGNIPWLLQKYRESPQVTAITSAIREGRPRLRLSGLSGAQKALVLAAAAANTEHLHLVICESKEEAAYLFNDVSALLSESHCWFFPDSFKRPAFFDDLHPTQMLQRSETVNKLSSFNGKGHVVVTYPEAIFEKVVRPATLAQHRIEVVAGGRMDVDFAIEILVEYGFQRTDFVYEPGQFSIRGGIIDLFSYGNDLPYRIELFDDEVESIRTFDPLTQLSKERLSSVSIIPNLNTRFRQEEKAPLLTILPEKSVLWVTDLQFVFDRLLHCFEQAQKFAERLSVHDPEELREIFRDRAFVYPGEISDEVEAMRIVLLQ